MHRNQQQYFSRLIWKSLVFFSILTGTIQNSYAASACQGQVSCLEVDSISINDRTAINGYGSLVSLVWLTGDDRGATVHAQWTLPDGIVLDRYANVTARGRATFPLVTGDIPGTYTLKVVGARKAGTNFVTNAISSKSITINYGGNQPPVAVPDASVQSGTAPLTVNFNASRSYDPDGIIANYFWSFDDIVNSRVSGSDLLNPSHTFNRPGVYRVTLTVRDNAGLQRTTPMTIKVSSEPVNKPITGSAPCKNCMSVDKVNLVYNARKGKLLGDIKLVDNNNSSTALKGALIQATWVLPDGSSVRQKRTARGNGMARFRLNNTMPGVYKLEITTVTLAGHTFSPDTSNVLSGMIEVIAPDNPAAANAVTLVKAIYFSANNKLWIRASSSAAQGSAKITASLLNGDLGQVGWKAGKGFYQQVFRKITNPGNQVTLINANGDSVSGPIEIR